MKICDMTTSTIRMQRATKALAEAWAKAQEHWDDQTRDDFEKRYLANLATVVNATIGSIQRMAKILAQAERDCEDEQG